MVAAGFFVILSAIKNVRYTFMMFTVPGNFSLISKSNRHDCLMAVRVEISVGCRFSPDHDSGFSTGISPFFSLLETQHILLQWHKFCAMSSLTSSVLLRRKKTPYHIPLTGPDA